MNTPGILVGLLVLLAVAPTMLKAQDCTPLDPRQQVSEKTTKDIAGSAQTVFKVGRVAGDYKGTTEKEVKNLYDKYPEADKIVLKDKLVYLFCTTLKDSGFSSDERIGELHMFIKTIQDLREEDEKDTPPYTDSRDQTKHIGDGNKWNELHQFGNGNQVWQNNN
jgi:hypothetical protein